MSSSTRMRSSSATGGEPGEGHEALLVDALMIMVGRSWGGRLGWGCRGRCRGSSCAGVRRVGVSVGVSVCRCAGGQPVFIWMNKMMTGPRSVTQVTSSPICKPFSRD